MKSSPFSLFQNISIAHRNGTASVHRMPFQNLQFVWFKVRIFSIKKKKQKTKYEEEYILHTEKLKRSHQKLFVIKW